MPGVTSIAGGGDQLVTVFGKGSVIVGGGNDTVNITGHGHMTVGGGNDWLTLGGGGSITELGWSGADTITLGAGNDTINVQGMATISGAWGQYGSATLSGGELDVSTHGSKIEAYAVSGSATLLGGILPTEFVAGSGFTSMMGGSAADTFIGGSGSDTMTGGTSTNVFEFDHASKGGATLITNFVSGEDTLYLEGHSLSFLQSKGDITSSGGNTFISLNGGHTTIELQGVTSLNSSDVTTHKP
jgi:Ca2+-binding RTX toxin-like protein